MAEEWNENEKTALDLWRARLEQEEGLPADWREGIYTGMVERLKVERPGLRGLPTDLVMRLVRRESQFDPGAVGSAGEIGLTQLKPAVAEWVAGKAGMGGVEDLADPRENLLLGMSYLQMLRKRLGGLGPAVEAYNVGPEAWKAGRRRPSYVRAVLTRNIGR